MTVTDTNIKQYKRKRGPLILSAATVATGRDFKAPDDTSRDFTKDIGNLVELAKIAERGKLTNVFFVDHLTWFDNYGDYKPAAKHGVNASRIDPSTAVVALAAATKNIGFILTLSTISEHPYHFHRRLASLDHLTNGRVGWNIVASYLPSSGPNLLNGASLPEHDERYIKTEEYLDVVYDLLLSSWRDDAVVNDRQNGVFADPDRIRKINHFGKYFNIPGPAIVEPSIQRFPLIIQAGTSKKGIEFAAENAELVFIVSTSAYKIAEIRKLAKERFNRDPYSIKFITTFVPFLGLTHEEAVQKHQEHGQRQDPEASLVAFSNVSGFDLSVYDWDEEFVLDKESNGVKSTVAGIVAKNKGAKTTTKRKIAENWHSENRYVGTAEEVADQLEAEVEKYDLDGFNFQVYSFPTSLIDIVDLLIPELQKRGLAQKEYPVEGGTLRENFYGKEGQTFVPGDHPAYNLRWREGVSKVQFEKELDLYKQLRQARRDLNND